MSRATLRAGIAALRAELVPEPCAVVVVPHDGEHPARWWFASLPLGGLWRAVSVEGEPEYAAERIAALRPRCPVVALFSCAGPVGEVLQ